jgi:hypothetical protein
MMVKGMIRILAGLIMGAIARVSAIGDKAVAATSVSRLDTKLPTLGKLVNQAG